MSQFTDKINRMFRLKAAYQTVFTGKGRMDKDAALRVVVGDLERFCRVSQSSVVVSPISRTVDTHATMVAEGRREVFNRIAYYLNLSDDQLNQMKERADET